MPPEPAQSLPDRLTPAVAEFDAIFGAAKTAEEWVEAAGWWIGELGEALPEASPMFKALVDVLRECQRRADERDRLQVENERLRKVIPSKYDLGAAIYYLESHELRCKYDKGTSDGTRAEIHRLIDDLKVFRHAVHMPDATAVAFDEQEATS